MALGKKLANYRKLAGLTQQQLGEQLNLSPQAISKWENDLAEPDLATLRTLADLYKVSVGELIDPDTGVSEPAPQEKQDVVIIKEEKPETIGFCKNCGIAVTEETLGEKEPVILCKKCRDNRDATAKRLREEAEYEERARKNAIRHKNVTKLVLSLVIAGIVTAIFMGVSISAMISSGNTMLIAVTLIGSYIVFSFIACLFYDCFVNDVIFEWTTKSFQFPGLIWEFDFDGFLWMIGMKILFWFLGLILGILAALVGIVIGMVCAPFIFPFIMGSMRKAIKNGTESDFVDYL